MNVNRLAYVFAGVILIGSFFVPTHLVPGGGLTLDGWWLAVAGFAVLPLAHRREWGGSATSWCTLFLLGTAGWLALTQPLWLNEFWIRPHKFRSWGNQLALGLIAAQAVAVAVGLWKNRLTLAGVWRQVRSPKAVLIGSSLLLMGGAHFTLFYPRMQETRPRLYFSAQMLASLIMALSAVGNLLLIYVTLSSQSAQALTEKVSQRISLPWSTTPGCWDKRLPMFLALFVLAVTSIIAYWPFDRMPHIPDGLAYLFQARCLLEGAFALPEFPASESFRLYLIDHQDGLTFSITNPGWPMILAIGESLGLPWLVNPVLSAATLFLTHKWIASLSSRAWANLVAILIAVSPWFLFLGASHMTHMATMFFFVSGFLLVGGAQKHRRSDRAFAAGLCFGMVFLIRPLDGLLLGGAAGVFLLLKSWRLTKYRIVGPLSFSLGAILVAGVLLVFNHELTGEYLSTPTNTYIAKIWPGSTNRLGFGPEVGNPPTKWGLLDPIPGHGWRDVLLNSNQNIANLNVELFGWTTGSLFLIGLFFFLSKKTSSLDRLALTSIVVLGAAYNLYWFSGGPDFGPRYWFSMLVPVAWLSARGAGHLVRKLAASDTAAYGRVFVVAAVLLIASLGVFVSWRIVGRYHDYRGFHSDYRDMLEAGDFSVPAASNTLSPVVFVSTPSEVDYGCAFLLNQFPLSADNPIFVRDLGVAANARVMMAFPGKPAIFVDGRAKTHGRAKIRRR